MKRHKIIRNVKKEKEKEVENNSAMKVKCGVWYSARSSIQILILLLLLQV